MLFARDRKHGKLLLLLFWAELFRFVHPIRGYYGNARGYITRLGLERLHVLPEELSQWPGKINNIRKKEENKMFDK